MEDYDEMLVAAEQAFELDPEATQAIVLLAEALVETGKKAELASSQINRGVALLHTALELGK